MHPACSDWVCDALDLKRKMVRYHGKTNETRCEAYKALGKPCGSQDYLLGVRAGVNYIELQEKNAVTPDLLTDQERAYLDSLFSPSTTKFGAIAVSCLVDGNLAAIRKALAKMDEMM